jgi:hypothetical protein
MTSEGDFVPLPAVVARLWRAPPCLPLRKVAPAKPALERGHSNGLASEGLWYRDAAFRSR